MWLVQLILFFTRLLVVRPIGGHSSRDCDSWNYLGTTYGRSRTDNRAMIVVGCCDKEVFTIDRFCPEKNYISIYPLYAQCRRAAETVAVVRDPIPAKKYHCASAWASIAAKARALRVLERQMRAMLSLSR